MSEVPAAVRRALGRDLSAWYRTHRRELPWRESGDPYAVWVSEVMLQQTQVATVRGYYERWMERFPTVAALARAEEDDVLHAWQGLGYYSRARNLWRGARQVLSVHGGRVPRTLAALRELPGVGPYSAGAIASIAHGERAAIVDGNVARVLCRLFGLRGDPARAPLRARLWAIAEELVPEDAPGDFNQAMMELGATVCTPRSPRCTRCPVARRCKALEDGTVDDLPETARRPAPTAVARVAAVLTSGDRVLVTRVPPDAPRWAGMWQFPNADVAKDETALDAAKRVAKEATGRAARGLTLGLTVRHSVTRYRITLDVFRAEVRAARAPSFGKWTARTGLDEFAMPSAHRRIARWMTDEE
jgi:A/G-specific adenine glycosylase